MLELFGVTTVENNQKKLIKFRKEIRFCSLFCRIPTAVVMLLKPFLNLLHNSGPKWEDQPDILMPEQEVLALMIMLKKKNL